MVKSVLINDKIHELLKDKVYEMQKAGLKIGLSDLAEGIIGTYIDIYEPKPGYRARARELGIAKNKSLEEQPEKLEESSFIF